MPPSTACASLHPAVGASDGEALPSFVTGERPDPWGEEQHPPPRRQPLRRRNAFMLPARLLRQGAVVPGSSDGARLDLDTSHNQTVISDLRASVFDMQHSRAADAPGARRTVAPSSVSDGPRLRRTEISWHCSIWLRRKARAAGRLAQQDAIQICRSAQQLCTLS